MSVRDRHQRERLARRGAILAAAMSVFAAHGLDGATIEMIARQAEVAVGTIYLYFSSRDELFLTLMVDWVGGLRDRYAEIQARALDPLEELRAMAGAYIEYLDRSRGLFVAQLSVSFSKLPTRLGRKEELDRFEEMRTLGRECFRLWADSVARVFDGYTGARGGAATLSTVM
ncbi:MAG: TetR/AcrR family transcriptional regulator, partial [Candidatus Binataceae bacterium]